MHVDDLDRAVRAHPPVAHELIDEARGDAGHLAFLVRVREVQLVLAAGLPDHRDDEHAGHGEEGQRKGQDQPAHVRIVTDAFSQVGAPENEWAVVVRQCSIATTLRTKGVFVLANPGPTDRTSARIYGIVAPCPSPVAPWSLRHSTLPWRPRPHGSWVDRGAGGADKTALVEHWVAARSATRPPGRARAGAASRSATPCAASATASAADLILAAPATFEQLHAAPAVARCDRELGASGLGRFKRDDASALTPQEITVAQLVASGHSNREVASDLQLSVRPSRSTSRGSTRSSASPRADSSPPACDAPLADHDARRFRRTTSTPGRSSPAPPASRCGPSTSASSSSFVGLIGAFSSNAISAGVGALVGGWLCDQLGRKRIYQWDLLLYAFGLLWIIFASEPWMLVFGYVLRRPRRRRRRPRRAGR